MTREWFSRPNNKQDVLLPSLLCLALVMVSQLNFLFFHTLAELFSVIVGYVIFAIAWHSYAISRNHFLVYLGSGFFWIASVDLFHALVYNGTGIFPKFSSTPEAATQFWLLARFGEAILFFGAPLFVRNWVKREWVFAGFGIGTLIAVFAIVQGYLPTAYDAEHGLTNYKIASEYIIIAILGLSIVTIKRSNAILDRTSYRLVIAAIVTTIFSEFAFTQYIAVDASANVIGHVLKFVAFWLMYIAIIRNGLTQPLTMLAQQSSTYDAVPNATIMIDRGGIIRNANSAACNLAGKPISALLGTHSHSIFHPAHLPISDCPVCQSISREEALLGFEMEIPELRRWREYTVSTLRVDDVMVGFVQVIADISEQHNSQDALRASEKKYRDFVENLQGELFFFSHDLTFNFVYVSPSVERVLGFTQSEFLESRRNGLGEALRKSDVFQLVSLALSGKRPPVIEVQASHKNGQTHYFEISESPVFDQSGKVVAIEGIAYDVTKRKRAEQALRESNRKLRLSQQRLSLHIEHTPLAVIEFDGAYQIKSWNVSAERIFGFTEQEAVGQTVDLLVSESALGYVQHWKKNLKTQQNGFRVIQQNRTKEGKHIICEWYNTPLIDDNGIAIGMASLVNDVTERELAEARLLQQANYDTLTSLPNRILAMDRLRQAIRISSRQQKKVALMFVDLDFFKNVNDTLGHSVGDKLLKSIAKRLAMTVREGDTVARLGGDEFLVILPGLASGVAEAEIVAEKIRKSIGLPVKIEGREFHIGVSVGITVFPDDAEEPEQLLRNADTAMYQAKTKGRNGFQFYTPRMNEEATRRVEIENQLRYAIERNELSVVFQPQLDMASHTIIGAEALLRWNNREFGHIEPQHFISVAESSGLINSIGEWVIRKACREASHWQSQSSSPIRVSINVSPRQIKDQTFCRMLRRELDLSGLNPELLELELTESLLLDDEPQTHQVLQALKSLGVRLALDDFGTGYSSLSYLKRYPFNALKIDRSFVADIDRDPNDAALCQAIIAMASNLQLEVIGEGAETQGQFDFLKKHGANTVQGFYISQPLMPQRFESYLKEHLKADVVS